MAFCCFALFVDHTQWIVLCIFYCAIQGHFCLIEVFHSRDQNHVTAGGESILGVKLCNSCRGSGSQVIEISC